MKNNLFLALIIALGLFLRLWSLDSVPPSLNWDEISLGYNAYSILKTSKDEWGNSLPLSFRAYGDYKLPGYVYADIPFIEVLGLNVWGVRFPSVLAGLGVIIFIFLILKSKSRKVVFWGAFLTALTPWPIILSRIALEANLALFLVTAAVYFFHKGLKRKSLLIASSIFFGLSIFTYNSARVVSPLLLILLSTVYRKQLVIKNKSTWIALAVFILFFAVALPLGLLQDSSARYKWTAIIDEGAINRINELRGSSALPPLLTKINYNRVTYFIPEAAKNYISHFSPQFLFSEGGSNYQFSVPGSGLLYWIYLPFLILGIVNILKKKDQFWLFSLFWLLIAPLPAAITRDSPHALRSILMIPPLLMITALGVTVFLEKFKKYEKLLSVAVCLIIFGSFYLFWTNYSGSYVKNYSWSWQYGYKQAVDYIQKEGNNYSKIYISKKYGEPHEFLLFYSKIDPAKYRNDPNLVRYQRSDWFWVDSFDKYVFLNDWEVKQKASCNGDCLLITSPGNYPEGSTLLKTINFLDDKPAFDIVRLPQVQ